MRRGSVPGTEGQYWLEAGKNYLIMCQNPDGAGSFGQGGKSIIDTG
jgi:hypothetical protein